MLKLLSLFSGIGAFEKALSNLNVPFEVVGYCDNDKYASKAYSLIHNVDESKNLMDVCTVDTSILPKDLDLITYGFPCQDISAAGYQNGFTNDEGELTRSGLFFEALRIIKDTAPKIAIAENVKALTSKKFKAEFQTVLNSLTELGYHNYWAVLNAKDFGIPQNRERVFVVSIRADIDRGFQFPFPQELKIHLKDILEDKVEDKYFLSDKILEHHLANSKKQKENGNGFRFNLTTGENTIASAVTTKCGSRMTDTFLISEEPPKIIDDTYKSRDPRIKEDVSPTIRASATFKVATSDVNKVIQIANLSSSNHRENPNSYRVYDTKGLSPTLTCMDGGGLQPFIVASRGRNPEDPSDRTTGCPTVQRFEPNSQGIANTLTTVQKDNYVVTADNPEEVTNTLLHIRKLTPKECFRLMGFDDEDCDILVANGISNSQLYKMAGNSIVVNVVQNIFVNLLDIYKNVLG